MRHGKKFNHLKRKKGHRDATLRALAISLIEYKRISTTLAKAKALRVFVEPVITRCKSDTTHSRRMAFADLGHKEAVKELFNEISAKVADRPGGYVRIVKTGFRKSDSAEMAIIELVDFNTEYSIGGVAKASKSRRSRRGSGTTAAPIAEQEEE